MYLPEREVFERVLIWRAITHFVLMMYTVVQKQLLGNLSLLIQFKACKMRGMLVLTITLHSIQKISVIS